MKEYTILAIISIFITIAIDNYTNARILRRKEYYIFLVVIFLFKLLVNGYLTRHIVMYDSAFFLGIRLGTIPVEDFLFGFSMVTMTIAFWEYFKKREQVL